MILGYIPVNRIDLLAQTGSSDKAATMTPVHREQRRKSSDVIIGWQSQGQGSSELLDEIFGMTDQSLCADRLLALTKRLLL